ncbi:MAG: type I restriction enzyme HsdR N-terminal domain-containing protein [Alistipes sp.]|nr:type I restriction enzyme HsdR N-terminal domain-containing protein [Alistipes sp.]
MKKFPVLDFPKFPLRVSRAGCGERIWDGIRGIWLELTPEEWVRRHAISYLTVDRGIPPLNISQEYPVHISGMAQRADIVVTGKNGEPVMLVECKAPAVRLDRTVYAQAVRYNAVVGARYLMITNGLKHFLFEKKGDGDHIQIRSFPELASFFI